MFTREQYLAKECTHREYWAQFVTDSIVRTIANAFGDSLINSKDPHFNDIPLERWDRLANFYKEHIARVNKALGNGHVYSLSDGVCMLKEAARQIVEGN